MKRFFNLLGKNSVFFLLTLIIGLIFSGIGVASPVISGKLITSVVSEADNRIIILTVFLIVSLFQICFAELDEYMGNTLKIRQKRQMRKAAFQAFSQNDSAKREETASFISFINNDIPCVAEQYFLGTVDIIKCISIVLFSAASLISIHWILAVIIVTVSILIVTLPNTMRKKGGEARKVYSGKLAKYNTVLQSMLDGLRIIKAYSCRSHACKSVELMNDEVAKSESVLLRRQLIVHGATTILQVSKTFIILITGIVLVAQKRIDVGGLVAVLQLASVISAPIEVLAYLRHSRNEALPLLGKYEELLKESGDHNDGTVIMDTFEGLAVDHLSYQMEGFSILRDVSAQFKSHGKYLITGESGSGKSTLLRLLSRIGDLQYEGNIYCDQQEIRSIAYSSYYKKICPVFQEPYLFYATLEENILLGRVIDSSIYQDVIKKLNLEYLLKRYGGQEITPEIVETLSGGERQRVALARAMVGQPEAYLLDEVTSALDRDNADMIEKLLLKEPAMIIHICHKPNPELSALYDKSFVLAEGILSPVKERREKDLVLHL